MKNTPKDCIEIAKIFCYFVIFFAIRVVKHCIAVRWKYLTAIHYKPVERNVERNGYTVLY